MTKIETVCYNVNSYIEIANCIERNLRKGEYVSNDNYPAFGNWGIKESQQPHY